MLIINKNSNKVFEGENSEGKAFNNNAIFICKIQIWGHIFFILVGEAKKRICSV